MNLLDKFESLPDIVTEIDNLIFDAELVLTRKERKEKLQEAQALANAFQAHCEAGGNHIIQFNRFI